VSPAVAHGVELRLVVLGLQRALDVGEALADHEHLADVELLALDEHLLAHAHLAEVVQEARVADLLELVAREATSRKGPLSSGRRLGQPTVSSATRASGPRWWGRGSRSRRRRRCTNESKRLRMSSMSACSRRRRGLAGERRHQLLVDRAEGHDAPSTAPRRSRGRASRFLLMSWTTPITSPCGRAWARSGSTWCGSRSARRTSGCSRRASRRQRVGVRHVHHVAVSAA
jgi:hypothetical protein